MSRQAQPKGEVTMSPPQTSTHETALASMDAAIEKLAEAGDRKSQLDLARALMSKAIVLARLGRGAEELVSYDDVIRRFSATQDPELLALVAMAHNRRGRALVVADRMDEALVAFDLAWAHATGWTEPELARQAAAALYATGTLRKRQGRTAEALSAWGDMIRQFKKSDDVEVAMKMVTADQSRAVLLRQSERLNDAVRVYNDMIDRISHRTEAPFRAALGAAAQTRAECLMETENFKAAFEACESASKLMEQDKNDQAMAEWRAAVDLMRGRALRKLERAKDAAAAFSSVDKQHRESRDPKVVEHVATALVELAELMSDQSEFAKCRAFCDLVIKRYAESKSETVLQLVQAARLQRAKALAGMNDAGAALGALKDWVEDTTQKTDGDIEQLRGNPEIDQYLEVAKSA